MSDTQSAQPVSHPASCRCAECAIIRREELLGRCQVDEVIPAAVVMRRRVGVRIVVARTQG